MKYKAITLMGILALLSACSATPSKPLLLITSEEISEIESESSRTIDQTTTEFPLVAPGSLQLQAPQKAGHYNSSEFVPGAESGPEITILEPVLTSSVSNPMSIHVEFKSRDPDTNVNMESLKLTYKKFWGIDLTDRVIEYIEGESINAPEVELPEGEHTLEIYIEDMAEKPSTRLITVVVTES